MATPTGIRCTATTRSQSRRVCRQLTSASRSRPTPEARRQTADRIATDGHAEREPHRHPRRHFAAAGGQDHRDAPRHRQLRAGTAARKAGHRHGARHHVARRAVRSSNCASASKRNAPGLAAQRAQAGRPRAHAQPRSTRSKPPATTGGDSVDADLQFHISVARATGNRYFVDILTQMGSALIPRNRSTRRASRMRTRGVCRRSSISNTKAFSRRSRATTPKARAPRCACICRTAASGCGARTSWRKRRHNAPYRANAPA